MIAKLDEFKDAWRAIGRIAPERLSGLRRVATIESIGSSTRIEGARLSDRDVERLLSNLDIRAFTSRDEQKVASYAAVMDTVFEHGKPLRWPRITSGSFTVISWSIRTSMNATTRAYKTLPNHVEAFDADGRSLGVVFATVRPFETPKRMTELVSWTCDQLNGKHLHPLLVIAIFIVVFLELHPFQDGNGRLSRVLTTLLLLRAGYAYVPYSSLESVIEQNKEGYYLALRQTQGTIRTSAPDWSPWLTVFLRALLTQKRCLEKKIERERVIIGALPELSVQILELIRERGRITIAEAVRATGANRSTVKDHVAALAAQGHLIRHSAGRGAWYTPA